MIGKVRIEESRNAIKNRPSPPVEATIPCSQRGKWICGVGDCIGVFEEFEGRGLYLITLTPEGEPAKRLYQRYFDSTGVVVFPGKVR